MNILIRSLLLKQQKGGPNSKSAKGAGTNESSRKRYIIYVIPTCIYMPDAILHLVWCLVIHVMQNGDPVKTFLGNGYVS